MEEVTAIQGLTKCSNVYLTHYTYCPKHFFSPLNLLAGFSFIIVSSSIKLP